VTASEVRYSNAPHDTQLLGREARITDTSVNSLLVHELSRRDLLPGIGTEGNAYIAVAGQEEHRLADSRDALRTLIRDIKAGKVDHLL
jgi:hypothetical protein